MGWVDGGGARWARWAWCFGRARPGVPKLAAVPLVCLMLGTKINKDQIGLRDRSCLLRCSLRLKARLQYWHLYFFSGADAVFRGVVVVEDEASVVVAILRSSSAHTVAVAQSISEVLLPRASLLLKD